MLNEEQRHSLAVRIAAALAPEDQERVAAWGREAMDDGTWTEQSTAADVIFRTVSTEMFNNKAASFLLEFGPELPDVPQLDYAVHACIILHRLTVKNVMTLLVRVDAAAFLDQLDRLTWEAQGSRDPEARLVAAGRHDRYAVVTARTADGTATGVTLTRWPIETAMHDPYEAGAAAARNAIFFPLGRGPGRPAGDDELAALAASARTYAATFEAGEDLPGHFYWQHDPRDLPGFDDPPGPFDFLLSGDANDRRHC